MTIMSHVHAAMDLFGTIDIDPTPTEPPGVAAYFNMGLGWFMWIAGALGILGFFIFLRGKKRAVGEVELVVVLLNGKVVCFM